MIRIVKSLKTVNYKLWIAILSTLLIPTIYQTIRIYFLGNMPDSWGINIASQLQWINLLYEIIQEALILPLFFILGKVISNKIEFDNRVRSGLVITVFIYFILSVVIVAAAKPLVMFMAQDRSLLDATVSYIRLETVAALFSAAVKFMMLVFITMKKEKYMYVLLIFQMIFSITLDTFLISELPFSLKLGVNGIAFTNIVINFIMIVISIGLLKKINIRIFKKEKLSFTWMKEWFTIGKFSGLESLLRNLVFMFMIVRMINVVSEQGNYWIANNFIWQWLLLPGLALSDLVKQEIALSKENIRKKTFGYITLTIMFVIIWLLSIPLWKPFLQHVMNVNEYEKVFDIVLIQTGFYLTFLFNTIIFDSTFYGRGKTQYMLIQSLCINVLYYGVIFILYLVNIFTPTLIGIAIMFGIGITLDFIPTLILYIIMLKKENIRIDFKLDSIENQEIT